MNDLQRLANLENELAVLRNKINCEDPTYIPKKKYREQMYAARQRGIEWLYTFETWWQQWQESGKWEQRGNKRGQWCMGRKGDQGPYSPANVDIIPAQQNASDACKGIPTGRKGIPLSEEHKEKLRIHNTGKKQSAATCLKKSLTNKGKPWTPARRAAEEERKTRSFNFN